MTREIKFRAWDTEKNKFVDQGEIIFSFYGETNIEVYPNSIMYIGDRVHNGEPQRGRFIITQFTGLKDKNGKEIYERDICKVYTGKICQVLFEAPIFCLKILNDKSDFRYQTDTTFRDSEVIGNIYENPELLTLTKN